MSDILVFSARDLYDANGVVDVPKGSQGVVTNAASVPNSSYSITFAVDSNIVTKIVGLDDLIWQDGAIGPVRALRFANSMVLSDVVYPEMISRTDLVVGNKFVPNETLFELHFDEGLVVAISFDFNSGVPVFTPRREVV